MRRKKLTWTSFKSNVQNRSLKVQYFIEDISYKIYAFDGDLEFHTSIEMHPLNPSTAQLDFELNYLFSSNNPLSNYDDNGRLISRSAAATKGSAYIAKHLDFTTSLTTDLNCTAYSGTAEPNLTIKTYDNNNVETTNPALAVKTTINFSPTFDFELISGSVTIATTPTNSARLWVIGGVPELGFLGTKEFVHNLNLKFLKPYERLTIDGRVAKYMKASTPGIPFNSNQIEIIVTHAPNQQIPIMVSLEYFKV